VQLSYSDNAAGAGTFWVYTSPAIDPADRLNGKT